MREKRDFKNLDFTRIQLNCNNTIYVTSLKLMPKKHVIMSAACSCIN